MTATGEDVSVLLDREQRDTEYPALDDYPQVLAILAPYAAQGIVPMAIPPVDMDPPLPIERVPTQHDTDLRHLAMLAERHGYVTYAVPGPAPGTSRMYWGPPVRLGVPQPALSVDLGPETNVSTPPTFTQNVLDPVAVEGSVQDPRTGTTLPVLARASLRPPLAVLPVWLTQPASLRSRRLRESGTSPISAFARAQAQVDSSIDAVVGEGTLDGAPLRLRPASSRTGRRARGGVVARRPVVRPSGRAHAAPGSYQQSFSIAREGYGSTVPVVAV